MNSKSQLMNIPSNTGWYVHLFRKTIFIAIAAQTMSCMPVMKIVYGVHNPRHQSDNNVIKLANHLDVSGEIYRLRGYNEDSKAHFRYLGNTMPDILIFNSNGQLTQFEVNCSNKLDSIANLSPEFINAMPTKAVNISDFISDSYPLQSINKGFNSLESGKPLYAVKFAEFAGRLNKDNIPRLVEHLQARIDVNYILLNMDYTIKK